MNTDQPRDFRPFEDDVTVASINGFAVENGYDRITVHGQLEIAPGETGARDAHDLAMLFTMIANAAEKGQAPANVPPADSGEVDNPCNPNT
jgi:5-enolpyruvylshikimate-3-phosphate synthase